MKKYLIIILITTFSLSNLFGSVKQYEKALKLYNAKEYQKAYNAFKTLALTEPSNRLNFYLARTSYELEKYDDALNFYEQVLLDDPLNLRVRLEIAQTYLKLGNKQRAKEEFTYLLSEEMPKNINQYIKNVLKNLDSKKDYTFNNTIFFGLGYDDNIKSSTTDSYSIYVPQLNQNLTVNPDNEVSGGVYEYGVISNYTKKLQDNILLNTSLVGFSQQYFSDALYHNEMQVLSLSIAPTFVQKYSQVALLFAYDYMTYGHQSYLKSYRFEPSFSKKLNENYLNTITFKYIHKAFEQTANNYGDPSASSVNDTQKDSRTYQLSNKISRYSKQTGISSLEFILGKESDLDDVRVDIDKRYASIVLSNIYPINNKLTFNSSFSYNRTKYDNYDQNFQKRRSDDIYQGSLAVNYSINKSTVLSLLYKHITRESNFTSYDYSKNHIKSTIQYKF